MDAKADLITMAQSAAGLTDRVISYVESCYLPDGGYFFARVPPASLMDTFYAVSTLSLLGQRPRNSDKVVGYVYGLGVSGVLTDWRGAFAACAVLNALNAPLGQCRLAVENYLGSRGLPLLTSGWDRLYVEVISEYELLAQAIAVTDMLGITVPGLEELESSLSRQQNPDGSFGKGGGSKLASTYYVTEICRTLGIRPPFLNKVMTFLRCQELEWSVSFVEDVFWLSGALVNLNEVIRRKVEALDFVLGCERGRGGFSRSTVMGIRTLENTYYGVSVLKWLGCF